MIVFPNAKINIGLNIVDVRTDGYHDIETVFVPVGFSDILEVITPQEQVPGGLVWNSDGIDVNVPVEKNLCVRALRALQAQVQLPTVGLSLHKIIPNGAGLGGGSSDAAYVLTALNSLLKLNIPPTRLHQIAASIGADCPFFIDSKPVYATSKGDVFEPVDLSQLRSTSVVVVVPQGHVSTAEAYSNIPCRKPSRHLKELVCQPIATWRDTIRNDFEDFVFSRLPDVELFKKKLYDMGAIYAQMSGSGSSVFGIFPPGAPLPNDTEFPNARGFWSGPLNI